MYTAHYVYIYIKMYTMHSIWLQVVYDIFNLTKRNYERKEKNAQPAIIEDRVSDCTRVSAHGVVGGVAAMVVISSICADSATCYVCAACHEWLRLMVLLCRFILDKIRKGRL